MTLPVLAPWNSVLFLACCYLTLCRFGELILSLSNLISAVIFLCITLWPGTDRPGSGKSEQAE